MDQAMRRAVGAWSASVCFRHVTGGRLKYMPLSVATCPRCVLCCFVSYSRPLSEGLAQQEEWPGKMEWKGSSVDESAGFFFFSRSHDWPRRQRYPPSSFSLLTFSALLTQAASMTLHSS
ncbi:uncharacterized protein YALI1_A03842g [Yarrowia lipolytica]|uniref:Uncharacterized protein n=1 Tax=Yarrowia lipolytica TaxID=4952 RepID=A0A1D8N3L5_YARLL|nr:hypothetical protein YALI1_A03842g [Yarrowia lipolytica]